MEGRIDSYVLWLRALLVAGVAFFIGVAGHVTAEGLLPGPVTLAVLFAFAVLLSAPLLSRPASRLRLVVMTGRVQNDPDFLWASLDELGDHALPSVMNKIVRHALAQAGRVSGATKKKAGFPLARERQS